MGDEKLQKRKVEIINRIVANSKDAKFAKDLTVELLSIQGQLDVEAVELIVPTKDVVETYQLDDVVQLVQTKGGFLYKFGNTFYTFVPFGFNSLFNSMADVAKLAEDKDNEDNATVIKAFNSIMQWPTVALYDENTFWASATSMQQILNEYCQRNIEEAKALKDEETEKNAEAEAVSAALKNVADNVPDAVE